MMFADLTLLLTRCIPFRNVPRSSYRERLWVANRFGRIAFCVRKRSCFPRRPRKCCIVTASINRCFRSC